MLKDTMIGLVVAVIVISSVAWVSQFRRIREKLRLRKAIRAAQQAPKTQDSIDRFAA
ncbi:MAG TPA: hypothetical protein VGN01_03250 [Acidobacteriaceae bacterium]|jgi:hypothetical protein